MANTDKWARRASCSFVPFLDPLEMALFRRISLAKLPALLDRRARLQPLLASSQRFTSATTHRPRASIRRPRLIPILSENPDLSRSKIPRAPDPPEADRCPPGRRWDTRGRTRSWTREGAGTDTGRGDVGGASRPASLRPRSACRFARPILVACSRRRSFPCSSGRL